MFTISNVYEINNNPQPEKHTEEVPWIEKYRPNDINGISSQEEVKAMLQKTLETGDLPHLLFHGPPGTGKTSTILAIARQLFGPRAYKDRVVELNASDERGINVVRNKIGTIAKTSLGKKDCRYPCPDFRIIILDEADAMTNDAQSALRKTMEEYSKITRFCFICNYINQIIDPISSRCVKFRFKPISVTIMETKLLDIAKQENLKIKKKHIETISEVSEGDMRKGITYLQNTKYIDITDDSINDLCNVYPQNNIDQIIKTCKEGNIDKIVQLSRDIKRSGFSISSILKSLVKTINKEQNLDDKNKSLILFLISTTERKIVSGADEYVQMLNVMGKLSQSFKDDLDKNVIVDINLI